MPPFIALDFPAASPGQARSTVWFRDPFEILEARATDFDQVQSVLDRADAHVRDGHHVLGFVSYEAAPAFDRALAARNPGALPLAWFAAFHAPSAPDPGPVGRMASVKWRERPGVRSHADAVETIR